jgi:glycosyltransferase involved in cell wall biosynthesis
MSRSTLIPTAGNLASSLDIVCFSHLRWRFVWQRPQHLLTRLGRHRRVFVVEEPTKLDRGTVPQLDVAHLDGVTVLTPRLPHTCLMDSGFGARSNPAIRSLLTFYLRSQGVTEQSTLWYYSPLAYGAEPHFLERAPVVVYDAMDELSSFAGAPATIRPAVERLLARASTVLTGGPSLYEAYRVRHPNAHCVPSGVDARHFTAPAPNLPAELLDLPRPIIGYYGVLDERIDFELIAYLAELKPDWSLVLIGPVAKIERDALPRRPNIHYLGTKPYTELPAYLGHFDVAIMPFALNDATRFISPTKTLEYLAGGRPVVSTPVRDVMALYGELVEIADSPPAFVAAIERCLAAPADAQEVNQRGALFARYDWDAIAAHIECLLNEQESPERRAISMPETALKLTVDA